MKQNSRLHNIDLMRIICMLIIVLYHIQGHGGLVANQQVSTVNRTLLIALQSIYQLAVDGYALISGYIGYTSRHKYTSLISLWLRVLFYSVGITAIIWLISPASVSWIHIRNSFFPLLKGQYWYFTAYAGCFVLAPFVRAAIAHLSRKESTVYLTGIVFVFSVLPYLMRNDPFITASGNHALWLLILYALGAHVRKFDPFAKLSTRKLGFLLLFSCALQISSCFIVQPLSRMITGKAVTQWYFICHDSPTTLLLALLTLALFSRLSFHCSSRFFHLLVSSSFSVYLIHDHPLFRQHVIVPLGSHLAALPSLLLIPSVLLCGLSIYLLCAAADSIRKRLFDLLQLDALIFRLGEKLLPASEE